MPKDKSECQSLVYAVMYLIQGIVDRNTETEVQKNEILFVRFSVNVKISYYHYTDISDGCMYWC